MTQSYVTWLSHTWHDSFDRGHYDTALYWYVTWRIHMWHDLFMHVTWLIHICDMTQSYVTSLIHIWHDWFICDMAQSYVACLIWSRPLWHGPVLLCDMTHSYATWLIHICDMTHSYMWHDSVIYNTTHLSTTVTRPCVGTWHDSSVRDMTPLSMWHDSLMRDMTHLANVTATQPCSTMYEWVMSHTWMSHGTYEWVMSHMNESCQISTKTCQISTKTWGSTEKRRYAPHHHPHTRFVIIYRKDRICKKTSHSLHKIPCVMIYINTRDMYGVGCTSSHITHMCWCTRANEACHVWLSHVTYDWVMHMCWCLSSHGTYHMCWCRSSHSAHICWCTSTRMICRDLHHHIWWCVQCDDLQKRWRIPALSIYIITYDIYGVMIYRQDLQSSAEEICNDLQTRHVMIYTKDL